MPCPFEYPARQTRFDRRRRLASLPFNSSPAILPPRCVHRTQHVLPSSSPIPEAIGSAYFALETAALSVFSVEAGKMAREPRAPNRCKFATLADSNQAEIGHAEPPPHNRVFTSMSA